MKSALALVILALVAGHGAAKCLTIAQVIDRTPSLSLIKSALAMVPAFQKVANDPKARVTILAPSNKVLGALALQAARLGLTDPQKAAQLLLSHVIKGSYPSARSFLTAPGKKVQRYAMGSAKVSGRSGKGVTYVDLTPSTKGYSRIRIAFPSKRSPAIRTCAGVVYVVNEVFIPRRM